MKDTRENLWIEPITFKQSVRSRFLEIAAIVKPQVFRELAGKPFELLEKARMYQALNPILEPEFRWNDFETGNESLSLERKDLREVLIAWQAKNYLLETEDSEKWLLRWLVEKGIEFWARTTFAEKTSQEKNSKLYFSTKRGLKKGKKFRRKLYKEGKKGETIVLRRIDSPNGLPSLPVYEPPAFLTYCHFQDVHQTKQSLAGYIETVKRDFEKRLETFQHEVESYISENGDFETDDENLLRDILWTAQSQLNDAAHLPLASIAKVEPSDELKKQDLANPFEIKKGDLEITGVTDTTVSRAVKKTLLILGLKPRSKKSGRPRGKRQDEIDRQLLL